jgi:hypothetical protein
MLRVFLLFTGISKPKKFHGDINQFEEVERTGFTVVEWGGMNLTGKKVKREA